MPKPGSGEVRIIAGEWRGRRLRFAEQQALRPTPDRVRETLFNWLQFDIAGKTCLDLFAGSGALGFEAASRGAAEVRLIEDDAEVCRQLQQNIELLQAGQITVTRADAMTLLHTSPERAYDLVFLDPPYRSDLLCRSAERLQQQHWLANHAKIYVEIESGQDELLQCLPESWRCLKTKRAGQVAYSLWQLSE